MKAIDKARDFSVWVVILLFFLDCFNTELSILAYWDFWIMALSMLGQLYYLLFNILFCCLLFLIQDNADQNKQADISMSTEICMCVICIPDLHGHYEAGDFCCLDMSCSVQEGWVPACWQEKGSIWLSL